MLLKHNLFNAPIVSREDEHGNQTAKTRPLSLGGITIDRGIDCFYQPSTLIICSITSLATGSSWGTSGTIGIALIGIGEGLGFPLPVVAGAVLSGAYFGDKMSPLSDTTNMAPAMVGTDLYTHIKHMTYTTGVSYAITLVIEIALGFVYGGGDASLESVNQILSGIDAQFSINPLLMILIFWNG